MALDFLQELALGGDDLLEGFLEVWLGGGGVGAGLDYTDPVRSRDYWNGYWGAYQKRRASPQRAMALVISSKRVFVR